MTGVNRNPRSRGAQLQKMLDLQRKLDNIEACNCPNDCRGQGRYHVPESEDRNTGGRNSHPADHPDIPPSEIPPKGGLPDTGTQGGKPEDTSNSGNQGGNKKDKKSVKTGGIKGDFLGSGLDLPKDFSEDLSDFFSRGVEEDVDDDDQNDNDSNQSS